jgi:hypothetical protein
MAVMLATLALAGVVSPPVPAEVAGAVAAVRVWAYGTPSDHPIRRDLFLRDEVFVREVLETVAAGALHVRLRDDTMLRLGSTSRVVVDEFSPATDSASLLARITKGVCRFVAGKATNQRLEVATPTATIAARGTEFSVWIAPDGSTTVWVRSGQVEVVPLDGAPGALVDAGEIVLAPIEGGGVQRDATRPASDPGIADTPRVRMRRGKELR